MIKRSDALAKLNAKDEADFAVLEARIDPALAGYHGIGVDVAIDNGVSGKVINRIIALYSTPEAGWKVTPLVGDQHEPGTWLRFE